MTPAALSSLLLSVTLVGCGTATPPSLPVPDGAKVTARSHECPVVPDICRDYDIVIGSGVSSEQLRTAQVQTLSRHGWTRTGSVTPNQSAVCSAADDKFITIATGAGRLADELKLTKGDGRHGVLWSEKLRRELRAIVARGTPVIGRTLSDSAGC